MNWVQIEIQTANWKTNKKKRNNNNKQDSKKTG